MEFQEFQVILCFLGPSMFYNKFETYCKALSLFIDLIFYQTSAHLLKTASMSPISAHSLLKLPITSLLLSSYVTQARILKILTPRQCQSRSFGQNANFEQISIFLPKRRFFSKGFLFLAKISINLTLNGVWQNGSII